jgi:hypothetical protein
MYRYSAKCFTNMSSFNPHTTLKEWDDFAPNLHMMKWSTEKMELAQRHNKYIEHLDLHLGYLVQIQGL